MAKSLFLFCITWYATNLIAQSQEANPLAIGPGPIVSTSNAPWALNRNMAGLVRAEKSQIVFSYRFPYNLPELQSYGIGIILPWKPVVGISVYQSGTGSLRNQQISINTALAIEGINMGLRVKYWHLYFSGFKTFHLVSISTGIQIDLTNKLLLGVFIGNLIQSQINGHEPFPALWYTGLNYHPISKLDLHFEAGYIQGYYWELKLGAKYQLKDQLSVSTGFIGASRQGHFGVGFNSHYINLEYALSIHANLGISHQAGVSYKWQ